MESLELRKASAVKALKFFQKELSDFSIMSSNDPLYEQTRNSVIHSFEFTIEILWKYIKGYLIDIRKIDSDSAMSPRSILKIALADNLINKNECAQFLNAYDDRNRTSHTYHEWMAENIARNCFDHCKVFVQILERLADEKI